MGQHIRNSSLRSLDAKEFESGDLVKLNYLLEKGYDLPQAIETYHKITFYEGMTLVDVAERMISEGRFGSVPEKLRHIVNIENIVRHLRARGYSQTTEGVFAIDEPSYKAAPSTLYLVFE